MDLGYLFFLRGSVPLWWISFKLHQYRFSAVRQRIDEYQHLVISHGGIAAPAQDFSRGSPTRAGGARWGGGGVPNTRGVARWGWRPGRAKRISRCDPGITGP